MSLHAMWGTGSNQTMMIKGMCGKRRLHVLIDTRSTYNFLNEQLAKKLQCPISKVNGIWVEVANGQELKCDAICVGFKWKMQQQNFQADVYLLPLQSYDLILGIQWLKILDDISWNFTALTMTFQLDGQVHSLYGEFFSSQGEKQLNALIVEQLEWFRLPFHEANTDLLQLNAVQTQQEDWKELQELLQLYADIFQEPKGLPPQRSHDHRVPLLPGSSPVNTRLCRYASLQKTVIEEMVKEMLQSGVI